MKKLAWLLLLTGVFYVCACSRSAKKEEAIAPQEDFELFVFEDHGYDLGVILTEASLLEYKEDGKMHWKAGLNAGDTVIWKGEKRDAPRAYDGQTRTFYLVDMNGEYWVQDYAIAGPAIPAVIVSEETVLYTMPDLTSVARRGNITIPQYSLAAVLPDDAGQFVKISARLEGTSNPSISELYVRTENVSTDPNDIGSVKLARIASQTKNAVARKELLKNAMEMAEKGSRFNTIPTGLNDDPALFELELTGNLERLSGRVEYTVTAETVNLRELPSVDSTISGTMRWGDTFWVTDRTAKEITLDAANEDGEKPKGVWLRTGEGHWVFGAYVIPTPALDQ
jgi:hypothetical protein